MKRLLALPVLLTLTIFATAQVPEVILTRPTAPNREALDRLGLTMAWRTQLNFPGKPDSHRSVQLLPAGVGVDLQIAVQSQSGTVYLLDAQTGDLLWNTPVGTPYWEGQPIAADRDNLYVTRKNVLFVLNRLNGRQRLYSVDRRGSRLTLGMILPSVPSVPPAAADKMLYLAQNDRTIAYEIPVFRAAEEFSLTEYGGLFKVTSVQPESVFAARFGDVIFTQEPLIYDSLISFVTTRGLFTVNRYKGNFQYEFKANGRVLAPAAQVEGMAYVGSDDATLYAVNLRAGRLEWRYLSPAVIRKQPHATDKFVFVFSEGHGMAMLDRATGLELWRQRDAAYFLSHTGRFVYAADRNGKLLVLDIRRGTALGQYNLGDWTVRLANEYTDRIYLASHDGQLMCLYPRENAAPLMNKTRAPIEDKGPPKKDGKGKEPPKEKEPEKEIEEKVGMRGFPPAPRALGGSHRERFLRHELLQGQVDWFAQLGAAGDRLGELHVRRPRREAGQLDGPPRPDGRDEILFHLPAACLLRRDGDFH